jgi:hypothetical protein
LVQVAQVAQVALQFQVLLVQQEATEGSLVLEALLYQGIKAMQAQVEYTGLEVLVVAVVLLDLLVVLVIILHRL